MSTIGVMIFGGVRATVKAPKKRTAVGEGGLSSKRILYLSSTQK